MSSVPCCSYFPLFLVSAPFYLPFVLRPSLSLLRGQVSAFPPSPLSYIVIHLLQPESSDSLPIFSTDDGLVSFIFSVIFQFMNTSSFQPLFPPPSHHFPCKDMLQRIFSRSVIAEGHNDRACCHRQDKSGWSPGASTQNTNLNLITKLSQALNCTAHDVNQSNDSSFRPLLSTLLFTADVTKHSLFSIVDYTPWKTILTTPQAHIRYRRGLFNQGSKVLGGIF